MFICDDPKFIFLLVPKTATRSILQYCKETFPEGGHAGGHRAANVPRGRESHFKFCIVRNPYDRLCSAWWSTCKRGIDRYRYLQIFAQRQLPNTLLSFLTIVKEQTPSVNLIHTWPMVHWTDTFKVDRVLHFENLLEDFRALPFISNDAKLPHINVTGDTPNASGRPDWKTLIGPDECKIINHIYHGDFKTFKYEKMEW